MSTDDSRFFCPECAVTLDLHDGEGTCESAQMKANMLAAFDQFVARVVSR